MHDSECFDFAIIGGGIAGASLAYRLAGQASVVVLERESQPGYHATGRSAAMFMESYGTPQIQALTRASRDFYERPPTDFTEHALLEPRGCLYVAGEGQQSLLKQTFEAGQAQAGNVSLIDTEHALALVPCLRPEAIVGAMLETDARDLDVHALHQGFLRAMRRAGGVLQCDAHLSVATREGRHWHLTLADGRQLRARNLVNAAGAWADQVAQQCGVQPIGLQPCRRSAFTFDGPDGIDFSRWPAVIGIDESFYFKPDAGQLLGSPANADPVPPQDVMPEELDIATGIYHIEAATSLTIRRPRHSWAGLRSFVADGDLVVGWDDHCEGFFWLAAQGGYGIQSAAGVSQLACAQLLDQPLPETLRRQGVEPQRLVPGRLR
ncbi:NAD(P)/FAD-dependent oxidoreductase [Pseudomonas fluorescens]|uniref:FAD-dependent catabolic D-arginine dehydrogenase DauA n=1 Tax=Pseudomonas fluorescens TaxID=294 RepID=A0A5E7RHQ6_PSEFL|nr:FAD-dependent oxidoreductase [Pseudomonas fluorescens]VVN65180.1 FAD-dependent catabolic D-arginine dehydrogenase DauA [Pseudomonas fluorescens]VVP73070.1 FAD-dependent catabolic D-arginine dehydrogenase DauA [Pseudomonas fluorescens]